MDDTRYFENDIGVIEQKYGETWRTLARIGPYQEDTIVEALTLYQGTTVRVRYFHNEEEPSVDQ